jgi:uncharacterized protein (TIGR02391 family)
MPIDRRAMIQDLVQQAERFRLCGPSDDPDEITAVTSGYQYLLTQLKAHAVRLLPPGSAESLRNIDVEIDNIYSAYTAKGQLDALLPDILDALDLKDEPEPPIMTKWYLEVRKLIREIARKAADALDRLNAGDEKGAQPINEYLKTDYQRLEALWNKQISGRLPTYLGRHIRFGMANDYQDIISRDLPELEEALDEKLLQTTEKRGDLGFENLLHRSIVANCYQQYRNGHLRDAVLNSIVAIFDLIRTRTGLDLDGSNLVNKAFSLTDPYLVLSEIATESGQNDQKGFIQIFSGSYQGIRNPKAHTLNHDLNEAKAAQYLVFASLLARRVEESRLVKTERRGAGSAAAPLSRVPPKKRHDPTPKS